jgi:hypothetical protein
MMYTSRMQTNRIVRAVSNRWQRWQKASYYKRLSVSEAFSAIYQSHAWGSLEDRPFCSGDGSIREEAVGPYCEMIREFIAANNIRRVVDLGCGDFAVGSRFIGPAVHYLGVDVVPDLIRYNQEHFGALGSSSAASTSSKTSCPMAIFVWCGRCFSIFPTRRFCKR